MRKMLLLLVILSVAVFASPKQRNNKKFCELKAPLGMSFRHMWAGNRLPSVLDKRISECSFDFGIKVTPAQMESNLKMLTKGNIRFGAIFKSTEDPAKRIGVVGYFKGVNVMIILNASPLTVISVHPTIKRVPNNMVQLGVMDTDRVRMALKAKKW